MKFSIFTLLSLVSLVTHTATADTPLYNICFSQEHYTPNSPYTTNLNNLLTFLSTDTPPTGFGNASIGQSPNKINGLALCRGDVTRANCTSCIKEAGKTLQGQCPTNKGAIIWYDNCLLKYSDVDFFGQIDNGNKFYMYNVNDFEGNAASFNKQVNSMLSKLVNKARKTRRFYAIGGVNVAKSNETLYGLVQCTGDLTSSDCKTCLDVAISELPRFVYGKIGGRTVGGSCNVRYELYQFAGDAW